ncbi:MAG: pyridoxamine kinase [Tractidigestivibacter sp.]|jgi:pyridoxine kinase|uniref:pyridoxamine kinase n=1 Tax=Tractidigestivibacter sp. TaxID=2847320 RepID=UPI003D8CEDDD
MTSSNPVLYQRKGAYIPRVAAVHDLCGYGKCSLGTAIPVLSAAGCDVCPVPTSLFSAHTRFPIFYMHDTTSMLNDYLDAWIKEGVELDAIYSGFLGSAEQVESIKRLYREHPKALRIVDPVMGDDGILYPTYTKELCDKTRELVKDADVLTPNLTEAHILTGMDYHGTDLSDAEVDAYLDAMIEMGAKAVVLKGVMRNDGTLRNFIAGRDFDRVEVAIEQLPYMCHGTGDLFASAMLGAIMCGKGLRDAVQFASGFVRESMILTRYQPDNVARGVSFESILGEVTELVPRPEVPRS